MLELAVNELTRCKERGEVAERCRSGRRWVDDLVVHDLMLAPCDACVLELGTVCELHDLVVNSDAEISWEPHEVHCIGIAQHALGGQFLMLKKTCCTGQ